VINDYKDFPRQVRAARIRAIWLTVGAILTLVLAYGVVGTMDYAEKVRNTRPASADEKISAYRAGFKDGMDRVRCVGGIAVDNLTNETIVRGRK
jgi:hypothetical protein